MTDPVTISADYTLRPSELVATLALLVEARQPVLVTGAPGCAKSALVRQVAADAVRHYLDVRALLLDPVDLHGTLDDALNICDKLNRRLGYDREAWTAMVAASMAAETPGPGDPTAH